MTYLELYKYAERKLEKNEITIGEYEEMIAPLRAEIPDKEKRTDDKWVLVSDRLPEHRIYEDGWEDPSDYVIVVMASGYMHITRYWSKQSEVWIDLDYPTTDKVVAWRPLPEFVDPNDMTHVFDGVKEIPADFFKGWYTDDLKNMEDDKK